MIHTDFPVTQPCSCDTCTQKRRNYKNGESGVYFLNSDNLVDFIKEYNPIALTYAISKRIYPTLKRMNMGESKGLGMSSCLIYPTKPMLEFIKSGKGLTSLEKAKLYVAITRATHIVGIVVPDNFEAKYIRVPLWSKE